MSVHWFRSLPSSWWRHFATTEVWLLFALCLAVSFGVSLLIIGMFPRGRAVIGNSIDLVQGGLRRA